MKKTALLILGLAVSAGCLWAILRNQPLSELLEAARSIRWGWIALSTAVFYATMGLRAVRWALFFAPPGSVKGRSIFGPMMAGYALNSIFPARVGEPVRAALVARREGQSFVAAFATVVAERIVDSLTVLAALAAVFLWVDFGEFTLEYRGFALNAAALKQVAQTSSIVLLPMIAGAALLMTRWFRRWLQRMLNAAPFLPAKIKILGAKIIESFAQGFDGLRDAASVLWIVIHSALIWGGIGWSVQILGRGFGVPMTFMQGLAIMAITCVAIIIPAAPGYWGLFEAGFLFAASILGLAGGIATLTAMGLLLHLTQYAPVILIGFGWAAWSGVSLAEQARRGAARANGELAPVPPAVRPD